ncbi:CapA family protein [Salimicrobium flavidum]|uniref:Poly-gamma-glutamate synthesis protein (Capsule biosynthesis protein) n=1 Tax=Salimicrobium flavidum TaxID=570947 RepID=A0A1N7JIG6_9BACI|nr:CapA family protein [Salimicrobium flavidum]SIS49125.1 poly-gamma-glutamate synthesis protein (capsule biosynthesis protein) [Salimicrobium flavidum]
MKKVIAALSVFLITFVTLTLLVVMLEPFPDGIEAWDLENNDIESFFAGSSEDGEKNGKEKPEEEPVTLTFTGDVLFEQSTVNTVEKFGYSFPFQHVKETFRKDDLTFVNLETPITERGEKEEKLYNFRAEAEALDGMQEAGIDAFSLANNHTLDYSRTGLEDTLQAMEGRNLPYIGAGEDKQEAYKGWKTEIKGETIHFLAFSRVLPEVSWYAREDRSGIASGYQVERMERLIEEAEQTSDHVIVQIHWGDERQTEFQPEEEQIAHRMVDAGADVIVGHHPHVMQGFEYYEDGFIAYSLGNFLFPDYVEKETAYTGYLQIRIKNDDIQPSFVPMYIKDDQVIPAPNEERALERLRKRSSNIHFDQYKIEEGSAN